MRYGTVAAFDEPVGLGAVRTAEDEELGFHCTQVADGSRIIVVGAAVTFDIIAGRHGCWEAANIRPAV